MRKKTAGPKVESGRVIRRLAGRTVLHNKGKSAVTVLAIALCTFLFTALFTVAGSLTSKYQDSTARQVGGTADGAVKYLNEEEYARLASDSHLKEVSRWIYVGEAVSPELTKLRTEVHWADAVSAEKSFCAPEAGRLPADDQEEEIAVSTLVLQALGKDGDPEELLGTSLPLLVACKDGTIERTFTVVGIYPGDRAAMSQIVLVSKAFQERYAPTPETSYYANGGTGTVEDAYGRIDADIDLFLPVAVESQLMRAVIRDGLPENVELGVNWSPALGTLDGAEVLPLAVLLFTTFLSGYLIISNVYRINVYADIRSLGLLKTVGTSGRQLGRLVKWQAVFQSVPGIGLGLLSGAAVGGLLLPLVMRMTYFSDTTDTKTAASPWIWLFSAAFSYGTVRCSIRRPMRIASRVTPIEAARFTGPSGKKTGKYRGKAHTFSVFGFAARNVRRDPGKVFLVVLSLSLSLVVLNSAATLVRGFDEDKYVEHFIQTDFSVTDATVDNPALAEHDYEGVTDSFLQELAEQEGVLETGNIYYAEEAFYQELNERDFARIRERLLDREEVDTWMRDGDLYEPGTIAKIYGMDAYAARNVPVLKGLFDEEAFRSGDYILVNEYDMGDGHFAYFLPGEKVAVHNRAGEEREYTVMATVEIPYAFRVQNYMDLDVSYIFPTEEFNDFFGARRPMRTVFDVTDEAEPEVEEWISDFTETIEPSLTYTSRAVYKREFAELISLFQLVGGLLTGILGLIGVLNLINTLVTSMLSRRLELAMLEAVGMTKRVQKRAICLEGVIYGLLTAFVGLSLCALFSAALVRPLGADMWYFSWKFTLLPAAVLLPVLLLTAAVLPAIVYRFSMGTPVVERLRMAEG